MSKEESRMREIITIKFFDMKSDSEAVLIIRSSEKEVSLCISLFNSGDIDVRLSPANAKQVIQGLKKAVDYISNKGEEK